MADLPPLARLADNVLGGALVQFIRDGRDEGQSWDRLARELFARTEREIDVNGVTIQAWAERLGIEEPAA